MHPLNQNLLIFFEQGMDKFGEKSQELSKEREL